MPKPQQRRILAVDGNEAGRYVTTRTLRQAGFAVTEAASGAAALRMAQEQPDLILLDVNLPDIGGFDVCRQLKADPLTRGIPVLHHSATYVKIDALVTGLEGGADGFLKPPIEPRELIATIRAFIRIKDAEEAVRKNLQRFQLVARATFNVIWDWDLVANEIWWNENLFTQFGHRPEEVTPDPHGWSARIHPDDRDRVSGKLRAALVAESDEWSDEYRFLCKDGSCKFVEDRGTIIRDGAHRAVRMLGAMRDVTLHKQDELKVRATEIRMELALAASRMGVWEWNLRTTQLIWSSECYEIMAVKELADRPPSFTDTLHPEDTPWVMEAVRIAIADHAMFAVECRVVDGEGEVRWVANLGRAEYDATGAPLRLVGTVQDITARKTAEETLRVSLREKEVLLKEVHHRVKNNLQVVMSLLRLESNRQDSTGTRVALRGMQDRIRSMAILHETIYRSENLAHVNLGSYLTRLTTQLVRGLAPAERGIRLELNLAPVMIEIDQAIPCGLIVNELVTNALKHGFPGGRTGEIRIDLAATDDGSRVRLCISDGGAGVPAGFDVKQARSLGLQLVSDLSRQLQGSLEISPGPGGRFTVTFPLHAVGAPTPVPAAAHASP